MRALLVLVLLSATAVLPGCDQMQAAKKSDGGGVALIDLDVVAKLLGRDAEMNATLKEQEQSLNKQLAEIQGSVRSQIDKKKEELGEKPTEEATKSIVQLERQAALKLNEVQAQAQTQFNQQRAKLIQSFRDEVKTVASQVAKRHGLSLVVAKSDSVVLAYDASVDITQEVAEQLGKFKPAKAATAVENSSVAR